MYLHKLLSEIYSTNEKDSALKHLQEYYSLRELFLQNKYNKTVKAKQYAIEMMHKEKSLSEEKYANLEKQSKIIILHKNLTVFILLFLSAVFVAFATQYKRKKERLVLMSNIKSHKQQFILLNKKQKNNHLHQNIGFKELLVETMNLVLMIWERHTNSSRIDLAQQSMAWTVTIDNGTLRTRSLDKYLNLDTLPKFPRWKNVIKTCHFLLSDESLNAEDRSKVNEKLDNIMLHINKKSLKSRN